jgi:hypothetical protein
MLRDRLNSKSVSTLQERFIKSVLARIELLLIHLHSVEQVLIKKGIITEEEFLSYIQEATSLPNKNLGTQMLGEMLKSKDSELTALGTKVLKEMLAEMQVKGASNGDNESVHKG